GMRATHRQRIHDILAGVYGTKNVESRGDEEPPALDLLQSLLTKAGISCQYHFGHGEDRATAAGLRLADGFLDAKWVRWKSRLRPAGEGGFAFLNACSSAASPAGLPDL